MSLLFSFLFLSDGLTGLRLREERFASEQVCERHQSSLFRIPKIAAVDATPQSWLSRSSVTLSSIGHTYRLQSVLDLVDFESTGTRRLDTSCCSFFDQRPLRGTFEWTATDIAITGESVYRLAATGGNQIESILFNTICWHLAGEASRDRVTTDNDRSPHCFQCVHILFLPIILTSFRWEFAFVKKPKDSFL